MPKKKRIYHSDVISLFSLDLHDSTKSSEKVPDQTQLNNSKKQIFSPELIARLTERIKKL